MSFNEEVLVKVAKLYYEENYNFNEISEKLKLSRFKIYRMIDLAKKTGIIKIIISTPNKSLIDLENKLEKAFGLKRIYIIKNEGLSEDELKNKLGQAASELLFEVIEDNDVIGISWGTTVSKILDFLPQQILKKNVEVVQMTSGSSLMNINMICHELTKQLAGRFKKIPFLLFAPDKVGSKELKELLLRDESIKNTMDQFKKIKIAIFGIGSVDTDYSNILKSSRQITKPEFESLKKENTVGEIFSYYFDNNGSLTGKELTSKRIAIPIELIKEVPYSIAIAGGREKAKSILGAIRTGYINTLVTDEKAVEEIVSISKINIKNF
jgi:deoxyribonucleoside regulator